MRWIRKSPGGFTFVELVVATAVMMILASAALPLARVSMRRAKEQELHRVLREMRTAIDRFKDNVDTGRIAQSEVSFGNENYPSSLEQLVNGVAYANDATGKKLKLLRRIPIDPITGRAEWGLRAYADAPTSTVWGGSSVYDVYSKAEGVGLDGTKYKDW